MISLVRLSMPGTLLFFISLRVFLTSDVMIGGTFIESGLVVFSEGVLVLEFRTVQLCVKACADFQYFISVCLYFLFFSFYLTYLFLWSSFVCLFGPLPL